MCISASGRIARHKPRYRPSIFFFVKSVILFSVILFLVILLSSFLTMDQISLQKKQVFLENAKKCGISQAAFGLKINKDIAVAIFKNRHSILNEIKDANRATAFRPLAARNAPRNQLEGAVALPVDPINEDEQPPSTTTSRRGCCSSSGSSST